MWDKHAEGSLPGPQGTTYTASSNIRFHIPRPSLDALPDLLGLKNQATGHASRTPIARRRLITRIIAFGVFSWGFAFLFQSWLDGEWVGFGLKRMGEQEVVRMDEGRGKGMDEVVVGANGVFWGNTHEQEESGTEIETELETVRPSDLPIPVDPAQLVSGLIPPIPNPKYIQPTSSLGPQAEQVYTRGPKDLMEYTRHLTSFVHSHFPSSLHGTLLSSLDTYVHSNLTTLPSLPKLGETGSTRKIWMTDKTDARMSRREALSWKGNKDGWQVAFLDDEGAETHVTGVLGGSKLRDVWDAMPNGILHSDMLRYFLLLLHGGIYTDLDTKLLKPIPTWGEDYDLYRQGRGWLYPSDREEGLTEGEVERWKRELGGASLIVGVESDVGDREDWNDWWPRPLQIVQWTFTSAPSHPILLDVLLSITHKTSSAYSWLLNQPAGSLPLLSAEPKAGGPVGVMEWTGPGVWTDSVIRYLRVKYGVEWTELRGLSRPMRIGEIVVLPVTGFSPGVGLFGAKSARDPQAMVEHKFAGTWKEEGDRWEMD